MEEKKQRAQWSGKLGFILAAAGSAVGLGNIWKFPGKAFAGGGGAYLLIYLAVVILIGIPVMISELTLGRMTGKSTIGAFRQLNKKFAWSGWIGTICAFVILSYYTHVGGYVLRYIVSYATEGNKVMSDGIGYFYNLLGYNAVDGSQFFPWVALVFGLIFCAINAFILIKGVSSGIEKFNKIGMPALFIILIILLVRSLTMPGSGEGLKYMLSCDWSKVTGETFLSALGQAFYSLSLGMAIMITYGSYVGKDQNLAKNAITICGLDTLVAFLAGFIIVPAVFSTLGPEAAAGKGASFAFGALSGVFDAMPGRAVWGILFYVLLLFAAISSSISIEEGIVAFVCDEWGWKRKNAIIGISAVSFLIGVIYTISLASTTINFPWIDGTGINMVCAADWMEFLTDRLLLPVCAFGEALFVGWFFGTKKIKEEITINNNKWGWYGFYNVCIKVICPLAILVILVYSMATGTTIS